MPRTRHARARRGPGGVRRCFASGWHVALLVLLSTLLGAAGETSCDPGYFLDTEVSACELCPLGSYCPGGTEPRALCLGGFYGDSTGATTSHCSGPCSPGYYCPAGSVSSTARACGDPKYFCPGRSSVPALVPAGHFSMSDNSVDSPETRDTFEMCDIGHYCSEGVRYACPAGTFGSVAGLETDSCTGSCKAGYFCPPGSTSPMQHLCGSPAVYCPKGDPRSPILVPPGWYSIRELQGTGGDNDGYGFPTAGVDNANTIYPAAPGHYAVDGEQRQCAPGTFTTEIGRSSPCDPCPPGYRCVGAAATFSDFPCVSMQAFCPAGSSNEIAVDPGYYAVQDNGVSVAQRMCEAGYWCDPSDSVRRICPVGRYRSYAASTAECDRCSAGYFCPAGSTSATATPCSTGPEYYCPGTEAESGRVAVTAGHYSIPAGASPQHRTGQQQCEPGHFCEEGVRFPCPPGRFASEAGEHGVGADGCSGLCAAGFYCPEGSTGPEANRCGGADVFCPAGSAAPLTASPGFFTASSLNATEIDVADIQLPCPVGEWCSDGVRHTCPAGRYGCSEMLDTEDCSGPCAPGYFCAAGAVTNTESRCGGPGFVCPVGSAAPEAVLPGFMSIGGSGSSTRTASVPCIPGSFCVGGVAELCPSGRYGSSEGLSGDTCDGLCADGYECAAGSVSAFALSCRPGHFCSAGRILPCPPGTWSDERGLSEVEQCAPCPAGTANASAGVDNVHHCSVCVPPEGSSEGSTECFPGLLAVVAHDAPPKTPGLSDSDTLKLTFTRATNRVPVASTADVLNLIGFSASVGRELTGAWLADSATLVITVVDSSERDPDPLATETGRLTVWVKKDAGLRDATGRSAVATSQNVTVMGSWGVPSVPVLVSACAANDGGQDGIDAGDSLLLSFDQAVQQLEVGSDADLRALLWWSSEIAQEVVGEWVSLSQLRITIMTAVAAADIDAVAVRVGELQIGVRLSADLRSLSGETAPSSASLVVECGTWGDAPSHADLALHGATSLLVSVYSPDSAITYRPSKYLISWCERDSCPQVSGSEVVDALYTGNPDDAQSCRRPVVEYVVSGLVPEVEVSVSVAADNLGQFGPAMFAVAAAAADLASPCREWPPLPTAAEEGSRGVWLAPQLPLVTLVSTRLGELATTGGDEIFVVGSLLGLRERSATGLPSPQVKLQYQRQGQSYSTQPCIVQQSHTELLCIGVPGTGHGFEFAVASNDTAGAFVDMPLSFARAVVLQVTNVATGLDAVSTMGGDLVAISGRGFGPAAENAIDWVEYRSVRESASSGSGMSYRALNCLVQISDSEIICQAAPGIGDLFAWTVSIANQTSAGAVSSYAPPSISHVQLSGDSDEALDTAGGQRIEVFGENFGPAGDDSLLDWVSYVSPTAGSRYTAVNCSIVDAHFRIICTTQPGTGTALQWQVSIADQVSQPFSGGNGTAAYAPPYILTGSPSSLDTAGSVAVVLSGQHFGPSLDQIDLKYAVGQSASSIDEFPSGASLRRVSGLGLSRGDATQELTFQAPEAEGFAVWLVLRVSEQSANLFSFPIDPPSIGDDGFSIENPETAIDDGSTLDAVLRVKGASFGFGSNTRVVITEQDGNKVECPVIVDDMTSQPLASHDFVLCRLSVRVGDLTVWVGTRPSAPVPFDFDLVLARPQLNAIEPTTGPTAGGTIVRIAGDNLDDPIVNMQRYDGSGEAVGPLLRLHVTAVEASAVECAIPPGVGTGWRFTITSNNVRSAPSGVAFDYHPPVVLTVTPSRGATAGGDLVVVEGQDFGPPEHAGMVTVEGKPCAIVSWNISVVECVSPKGLKERERLLLSVGGQQSWPTNSRIGIGPTAFGRLRPRVDDVVPNSGDTMGGYNITLVGEHFGDGFPTVDIGASPCAVAESGDGFVVCTVAAGSGARNPIVLDTGEQTTLPTLSSGELLEFNYNPPQLHGATILGEAAPAEGGYRVVVEGVSLSASPSVQIGNRTCEVVPQSALNIDHRRVECVAPERSGAAATPVFVEANGLSSNTLNDFAYDSPTLVEVLPNVMDATATQIIRLRGYNFGTIRPDAGAYAVEVLNASCTNLLWVDNTELRCDVQGPVISGTADVVVTFWGKEVFLADGTRLMLTMTCPADTWATNGELCSECPEGASCAGGDALPLPLAGYYQTAVDIFVTCVPATACSGGNGPPCAPGYDGVACGTCQTSPRHYRLDQSCLPCPNLAWLMLVGFFAVIVILGAFGMFLNKRKVNLAAVTIGFDFIQILSVFSGFDFSWPVELRDVFTTLSASNLNLELVAPECSVNWTYEQKWLVVESVPLGGVLMLGLCLALRWVWLRLCLRKPAPTGPDETVNSAIGLLFTGLYFSYFVEVKYALSIFDCASNDNGLSALESDPSVLCGVPGGPHERLVPLALLSLLVYGCGIPLLIAVSLFVNRHAIHADQALRARGEGDNFLTNPNYATRLRFRKLYEDFRPGVAGWRMVLIARKLLFAIATIMFNANPLLQACVSISVLFAAYVAHAQYQPFLPRQSVSSSFLDVGKRHGADAVVDVVGGGNSTPTQRGTRGRRKPRQSVVVMSLAAAQQSAKFVFDYNALESSFLSCAMTVLLCGTMFSSAELETGSIAHVLLTVLVASVVVLSLLAFVGILGFEIWRAIKFAAVMARARLYEVETMRQLSRGVSSFFGADGSPRGRSRRRAPAEPEARRKASVAFAAMRARDQEDARRGNADSSRSIEMTVARNPLSSVSEEGSGGQDGDADSKRMPVR